MISNEKLEMAAKQVVDNCLHVKSGDKTLVITDNETKHIGTAIAKRLETVAGNVKLFFMEDFGARSADGSTPLKFPDEIKTFLETADVSVYAAQGKKGELQTFRRPMLEVIDKNEKIRHGHMIGISDEIMEMGMLTDYKEVQRISKIVLNLVSKAKSIHVTTKAGTDITAEFNPGWKWINGDGNIQPKHWSNLPDGEVFTCPKTINGHVLVDGILGDYLSEMFGLINKTPLKLELKDGRVISASCENKKLEAEFLKYIKQEENSNRVGEFAIGTNIGLKRLIGNLLQDEKFPGVHIAVGHPYPEKTGADWDAQSHLDMVIPNTTIVIDGKKIMEDGKFLI